MYFIVTIAIILKISQGVEMILEKETFESLGKTSEQANKQAKIICQCDYCGIQFSRLKHNLIRSRKNSSKDSCPNLVCVQKKRVETNRLLFGTDNAFQNEAIKKKIVEKNIELYGHANALQNKEIREKQQATCKERYGHVNVFGSKQIQKKIKDKIQNLYGVDNPFKNKEIREKQQQTLIEKFGVKYALQNDALKKKAMDTCIENHGTFPATNYGAKQQEIRTWLNSFGFNFTSNRSLIVGKEIDLYDPIKQLGIEYCGLHWHHEFSLEPRTQKYHYHKYQECLKQNVHLLTIFSDEWQNRESQCKSHIKSLLGVHDRRIFARKCKIREIDRVEGRNFFQDYHIQGTNKLGIIFFGLFHENELIGAISLGRHHRQFSNLVLDRLCFKDGFQVCGGASRLFSRCIIWAKKHGYTEILSFSDNRWSLGNVYKALNFDLVKDYGPDYSYVDIKRPNERISKQSQKKSNTNCPEGLTEYDWAHSRGLARIWDCGKRRWVFKI